MDLWPLFPKQGIGLFLVPGTPFLYIEESRTIILADTHFGFEEAASRGLFYSSRETRSGFSGITLPRIQYKRTVATLEWTLREVETLRVVVNGDIKHAFDRLLPQEKREVSMFIETMRNKGVDDIVVVRGNHDNFIKPLLRRLEVGFVNAIETKVSGLKVLITHGHEYYDPSGYDIIVIGHEHPSLKCFESQRYPSLLKIPLDTGGVLVVLPATGPYHPGTPVSPNRDDYLSPIIREHGLLTAMEVIVWTEAPVPYEGDRISAEAPGFVRYARLNGYGGSVLVVDFESWDALTHICFIY